MDLIIEHELATAESEYHRPHIFTLDLVGRLAVLNAAARRLRAMGARVRDEDAAPNDGGAPIIFLDMNDMPLEDLRNQCDASTLHVLHGRPERLTGNYHGVRIYAHLTNELEAA